MALTKEQAAQVLNDGGSVLYKGRLITKPEHLKYFEGTAEEKEAEKAALRERLAELEGESAESAEVETAADGGAVLDDSAEELNRHTRGELKTMAEEKGIEVGEKETKADIIAKILA